MTGKGPDKVLSDHSPTSEDEFVMARDELVTIVDRASEGCAESTRAKLRAVAEQTDLVAAGWFHCNGVACPARQAMRPNQRFQTAYDHAMEAYFGVSPDDGPFVVKVLDQPPFDDKHADQVVDK